jgi:hypothetical protein
VRIIIRRPHAYSFKKTRSETPIPGIVLLDAEGKYLGGVALPGKDAVAKFVALLAK